jgi:hypothetical protein
MARRDDHHHHHHHLHYASILPPKTHSNNYHDPRAVQRPSGDQERTKAVG